MRSAPGSSIAPRPAASISPLPVDTLLQNMSAKSCRYEIRRAEKLGDRLSFRTTDPTVAGRLLRALQQVRRVEGLHEADHGAALRALPPDRRRDGRLSRRRARGRPPAGRRSGSQSRPSRVLGLRPVRRRRAGGAGRAGEPLVALARDAALPRRRLRHLRLRGRLVQQLDRSLQAQLRRRDRRGSQRRGGRLAGPGTGAWRRSTAAASLGAAGRERRLRR